LGLEITGGRGGKPQASKKKTRKLRQGPEGGRNTRWRKRGNRIHWGGKGMSGAAENPSSTKISKRKEGTGQREAVPLGSELSS